MTKEPTLVLFPNFPCSKPCAATTTGCAMSTRGQVPTRSNVCLATSAFETRTHGHDRLGWTPTLPHLARNGEPNLRTMVRGTHTRAATWLASILGLFASIGCWVPFRTAFDVTSERQRAPPCTSLPLLALNHVGPPIMTESTNAQLLRVEIHVRSLLPTCVC